MTIDELLNKSKPAGTQTTAIKSTTSSKGGSALDRLVKASAPVAQPKTIPTTSLSPTQEEPIAPITQKVKQPSKLKQAIQKASLKVGDYLDRPENKIQQPVMPDTSKMSKDQKEKALRQFQSDTDKWINANKTSKQIPSAIIENIPLLGRLFKDIHDEENAVINDPSLYDSSGIKNVSGKDVKENIVPVLKETAKTYVKAPIAVGANIATAGRDKRVKFTVPGLGEVTNVQYNIAKRIQEGEDPLYVALSEGATAVLDTLFVASIASKPFTSRPVTVSKSSIPAAEYARTPDTLKAASPKSFRLYQKKTTSTPLTPEFIERMQSEGVNLGSKFDPSKPTYFRMTFEPKTQSFTGEVVQVKPSWYQTLKNRFKGDVSKAPSEALQLVTPPKILNEKNIKASQKTVFGQGEASKGEQSPIDVLIEKSKPQEVARETPKVDVKTSNETPSYAQAGKLIEKEGGFAGAKSRPALNRYAADELASSLGMSAKYLYEMAMQKNVALDPFLKALDGETDTQARIDVQNKMMTKLSGEAIPKSSEEALSRYYDAKLANDVKEGKTVSIGADDMKDHFNNDYNDENHPTYSKASYQTYEKLLKELPGKKVALTGGGAGVGKTEIIVDRLKDGGDVNLIYDSNLSSIEGAKNAIKAARDAGKEVEIYGIIADLNEARSRTIVRENQKGRGISDKTFANGHAGFPETVGALIEEGIIKPEEVHLLDLRKVNTLEEAASMIVNKKFVDDPLALVKNLGYNRESVTKDYARTNYDKTGKRLSSDKKPSKGDVRNGQTSEDAKRQGNNGGSEKGKVTKKLVKFPTIHRGGEIKILEGTPIKIWDGVKTFIYKGEGNSWVVSEAKSGRSISEEATRKGAIEKAKRSVENFGMERFLKIIEENKLPKEKATVDASLKDSIAKGDVAISKTPEEFAKRIEQLNKLAQSRAILRRTGGLPKKALGAFVHEGGKGDVRLQDATVSDPKVYFSVLAHELGHALEFHITGATNKDTLKVFGSSIPKEDQTKILDELKEVTKDMVGAEAVAARPAYYNKKTELLARFLQRIFENPERAAELAPTAMDYFERSAIEHPMVQEYLDAIHNNIDKGQSKIVFLRDMKQTYEKLLGKRVGTMVWNDEIAYRAMKERGKVVIERTLKEKFKNIKDDPALIFRVAESIKYTTNDAPVFGTRDFANAKNAKEIQDLLKTGYKPIVNDEGKAVVDFEDGEELARYGRDRYTPEQARAMYNQLSPEAKKLIREFTARKEEAKDLFNRDLIKNIYKVNGDLEGWVHHYFEGDGKGSSLTTGSKRFKFKKSAARKQRTGASGYVEDLQKAMTKALTELETEKQWNDFIETQFARVTKPIAKGAAPDAGWIEVQGNLKRGVGTAQETRMLVVNNGKGMPVQQTRYQMPIDIYKRYKLLGEVAEEASTAVRVMNSINRYWRVNILFHPGSAATNFISGGIQYGTKVLTDFYTELLTGSVKFKKTRRNLFSMITVLTPKGWQDAPDWIYGGDQSNYYGQFGVSKTPGLLDQNVDKYADKALKIYGAVERYWKKVIATAENAGDLKKLENLSINGFKNLSDDERRLLADINNEVDLFAYDYDNVPMWMENYQQSAVMQTFKPFLKYPYKYSKQISNMIGGVFDQTLPWQERMAKILALTTMMSAFAYIRSKRKAKQKTEQVPESAPTSVSTRGRLFIGTDEKGNEIFTRTAKYPFVNLTETGFQFAEGNSNQGFQSLADMIGGIAPVGKIALLAMGVRNEYEQYVPGEVLISDNLATFVPGTRILADIAKYFDPYQRTKTAPFQSFTSLIPLPTTDEDLRQKLRGNKKYIKNVPLEGSVERQEGDKITRTTTDLVMRNYKTDVLLGLFAGIYRNRIDPDVAKAFIIRKKKNDKKKKDK